MQGSKVSTSVSLTVKMRQWLSCSHSQTMNHWWCVPVSNLKGYLWLVWCDRPYELVWPKSVWMFDWLHCSHTVWTRLCMTLPGGVLTNRLPPWVCLWGCTRAFLFLVCFCLSKTELTQVFWKEKKKWDESVNTRELPWADSSSTSWLMRSGVNADITQCWGESQPVAKSVMTFMLGQDLKAAFSAAVEWW